jgi:hypothetical protein
MTIKVEIIIDEPAQIAGVEYARDLYNDTRPDEKPLSSEDYITFVMLSAADSYAQQADRAARMKEAGIE